LSKAQFDSGNFALLRRADRRNISGVRILVIADPHIPVPPVTYGGTERILGFLCEGLRDRGHQVRLIAKAGSRNYGDGLWTHAAPSPNYFSRAFRKLLFQPLSLRAARDVDVVINAGRPDYLEAIFRTRLPLLNCFHNPLDQGQLDPILLRRRDHIRFVGMSRDQVRDLAPAGLIDVVYNAADTRVLQPAKEHGDYLAFLGRITPNKGADTAIAVARKAGMKLKLAGNISNEEGGREFFETQVRPQLGEQIEYVGSVNDEAKRTFLGEARAMLFPIRWQEPFGLVVAESLACGTPVIATRMASTPEIIDHGKTGFLCDSEDEMVAAVGRLSEINRADCRAVAESRFSPEPMVDDYLKSIERLLHEQE
jgi:glycosyltransferase involved in cell wall biosynthesis